MKVHVHFALVLSLSISLISSVGGTCRFTTLTTAANWTNFFQIEPDGTQLPADQGTSLPGVQWPFAGLQYEATDFVSRAGRSAEMCTRLDLNYWICEGSYINLYNCTGILTFEGLYDESNRTGVYTITGGTFDFEDAVGEITDVFSNFISDRTIQIK
mmetsp:Transcript_15574/g.20287  ORF Transcript_15574/g.20287 Transcript_15574/m.20287 type:complete len:157 (-) Transcript_15574:255-725(-)|eukprot:CAMPEP_0198142386 /NCGR_PEP_ID=MMETSP1443-20131203/5181_1 /TAXON_ID=186043 /ORGANISM="Entomoneis sp., Strain CCMP2396" /LENGTH=156 /DNA_ID=CAMNT_0043805377 /DNA_START=63 /DNA_END=533 /DNA_ORIENTATION=+